MSDVVHLGVTRRGTPVDIVRAVAEADRRICLGNVEYHYFAGYSGGAKAIMPGVSTRDAIQSQPPAAMVSPGRLRRASSPAIPSARTLRKPRTSCGVDFILNVVQDAAQARSFTAAGGRRRPLAHREACAFLDRLYRKEIPLRAARTSSWSPRAARPRI